jgi:hypothetical protein
MDGGFRENVCLVLLGELLVADSLDDGRSFEQIAAAVAAAA